MARPTGIVQGTTELVPLPLGAISTRQIDLVNGVNKVLTLAGCPAEIQSILSILDLDSEIVLASSSRKSEDALMQTNALTSTARTILVI